ncbi:MAG TPA: alpha/beta fold hydrolase [Kofleriaceae bacterium]|nr:alpha/beta fold hydrolase [Kofleriaceae bacterium]
MEPRRRGNPTARRRRQVRWARRLRRLGLAWQNALEIARAGRLTAPYGAPFEVMHEERVYRLRRYERLAPDGDAPAPTAPLLLVPPLMVMADVYDISPDVSAVAYLQRAGIDVWVVDFGAPEREAGGMDRTLDDHVRAVSEAIERVRVIAGHDVHLAGYSQGGMFCYQAAAFRRGAGVASIITAGAPVDLHRAFRVDEDTTERMFSGLRAALAWPLSKTSGLPGFLMSTGFKLLSARKELQQLLDFVKNLHDREALEKREARRLFLGGEGFVAWPGPALRQFVDELIVGNRMTSGGFVIDGHTVALADLACPILYLVGSRDEMGRPAAVRGVRRACPKVTVMYEVPVKAGHFGLVVGTTALTITWPTVVDWMRWREGLGPIPARAFDVRSPDAPDPFAAAARGDADDADDDDADDDDGDDHDDVELARDLIGKTANVVVERISELSEDLGNYLDNARWQVPRLARLRNLQDDSLISLGKALSDQAREIPDRTFFLFRGRAFTYAEANRRVEAVVRGLLACGIAPGDRVGVMMKSRPSHLTVVAAINRLGAVAVLLSPSIPTAPSAPSAPAARASQPASDRRIQPAPPAADPLAHALALAETDTLIVDPAGAVRARAAITGKVLVLGGVEIPWQPGDRRELPPGVVDMEAIDPKAVTLPAWYRPDPGRARDLAMVFVSTGAGEPPRAMRVTNRRWASSALGAAAAATLTTRDTVYCCLPLHHPSGTLVAAASALVSGARLALASTLSRHASPSTTVPSAPPQAAPPQAGPSQAAPSQAAPPQAGAPTVASHAGARAPSGSLPEGFAPETFWDEVRRYGVSVVYYAGEMCRRLVDAAPVLGETNNPVRLFAGSGLRRDVWRRLVDRFGPLGVLEMYASTEANIVLTNARGKKLGSVGRALPGSPEVAVAAWSFHDDDFARDGAGRLLHARLDEPGMLIARLTGASAAADPTGASTGAPTDDPDRPRRIVRDAFAPNDCWYVTGDLFYVDTEGDHWFVDREHQMIATRFGPVASRRIEDALYDAGIALCLAGGRPDPDDTEHQLPVAAVQLHPGAAPDLDALSRAVAGLPEYARPRRLRLAASLPMTDGYRPIQRTLADLDFTDGPDVFAWDSLAQRYHRT